MYEVTTSIDLKVPASRVWDVITSFAEYDDWNPAMVRMHAVLTKGASISFVARAAGHVENVFGELVSVDTGREVGWWRPVSLPSAWWLRSERYLCVTSLGVGESWFVQRERFAGLSLPFVWRKLKPKVEDAFNVMNRALKASSRNASERLSRVPSSSKTRTTSPALPRVEETQHLAFDFLRRHERRSRGGAEG
jgi:hypothetical protein